ncbi:DNA sulfur modification protein DndB [Brevundimonas nasdae]|uniref:Uncharacterized protein n=1 Tax=Brevundimonas nasdae TaxID=172043 RepID=A0ABX8TJP0_9CAUL|nr:DNA sulfur modification protein DndB [Brevundimonas nasdae]QYC11438.1 hypothetical protein KWG56_05540 [Brevundimonas nasdae]QYC14226.1 hypothetical protein KWG63_00875 [Brevundimonas nasdae]
MAKFTKNVVIGEVHRVKRPFIGPVYVGRITIGDLADALIGGDVKYAPKYQRGLKGSDDNVYDSETLVDIHSDTLLIESKRAQAMAAKYLIALAGDGSRMLFNPDIIWNARLEPNRPPAEYDKGKRTLTLHSSITVPDSAHRHYAYYLLKQWSDNPDTVPDEVVIAEDGEAVDHDDLVKYLEGFDPYDDEESSVLVEIFNVPRDLEGKLFDEYNVEGKKPSNSASIDMFSDKTASRRFVAEMQKKCDIFGPSEIETRANTIAAGSRKITTVSTLDVAIKPFNKKLLGLEKQRDAYANLTSFFCEFYQEWAKHYPEFLPTASGKVRQDLRKTSFAMSNIMFFPMFRLAFEIWESHRMRQLDWRETTDWRDGLKRLAGDVEVLRADGPIKVPFMARDSDDPYQVGNPGWQGKILVQKFDGQGKAQGWSLSSTRQTRDTAYHYLVETAGIALPK